jgi:hypothetical protein
MVGVLIFCMKLFAVGSVNTICCNVVSSLLKSGMYVTQNCVGIQHCLNRLFCFHIRIEYS